MAIKNAILKKKIGEAIYDLMIKTTTAMVYVDDSTTLASQLTTILNDIQSTKDTLATLVGEDPAQSITGQIETAVKNAIDAVEDESNPDSLAGKIAAINVAIAAINDEEDGLLAQAKAYTDDKIGLSGTAYETAKAYTDAMKAEITSQVAGAFHFRGAVDYVDQLPTEGVAEGDTYTVKYAGTSTEAGTTELKAEFAYNGTEFIELGSILDLSAYYTAEQTTTAINTAKTEAINAAAADATTKADTAKAEAIAAAAEDATTKANAAQAAAEATAATALNEAVTTINASIATKGRFIASAEEPADLTENDLWAQIVE